MKKKKVGFWQRIKNFYNDSPWSAAFTLPILVLLIFPFLMTAIVAGLASIFASEFIWGGVLFVFLPYVLVPIWVFAGVIVSKKKLPYILSLIIGFGSFYLLFVVMQSANEGYTAAAQSSATKVIHVQTEKTISADLQRCVLGENSIMNGTRSCSGITANNFITAAINFRGQYYNDINPYKHTDFSLRISSSNINDEDVGYISLSALGSNIIIKSCHKTPCNKEANRQSSTVSIK